MEDLIRTLGSPVVSTIISTTLGIAIGALAAFMRAKKKDADASGQMLRGLGHDRIIYLGERYVQRGGITRSEYENLHDYLYEPYKALGGNGTAEKIMNEVEKLSLIKEEEK